MILMFSRPMSYLNPVRYSWQPLHAFCDTGWLICDRVIRCSILYSMVWITPFRRSNSGELFVHWKQHRNKWVTSPAHSLHSIIIIYVPMKVIITSKFWRSVLTEIQNCDKRIDDYLIIGSPLDVAIAADAKFDILLTERSSGNKLKLILGKCWK